jgi:hypothetical protein
MGHSLTPSPSFEPHPAARTRWILAGSHAPSGWNLWKVRSGFNPSAADRPHRSRRHRPGCSNGLRPFLGASKTPSRGFPKYPRQSSIAAVNGAHACHCAFPGPLFLPFTFSPPKTQAGTATRSFATLGPTKQGTSTDSTRPSSIDRSPSTLPSPSPQLRTKVPSPQQTYPGNRASRSPKGRVTLPTPPLRPRPPRSSHAGSRGCSSTLPLNQESGSPSLRPALHPVWLVPYPPNTAPQVKTHTGTLKHTPNLGAKTQDRTQLLRVGACSHALRCGHLAANTSLDQ